MNDTTLELLRCVNCGTLRTAGLLCRACGGREITLTEADGRGTLEAVTVVRVPPVEGAESGPYAVAVARLAVTDSLLSGRLAVEPDAAAQLALDQPVTVSGRPAAEFTVRLMS